MAIRLNNRQRIFGGLALQLLIVLGVVLASPEIILLGEVITLKTAPMSPQDLRSPVGLRLKFAPEPTPEAAYARLEQQGEHWELTAYTPQQDACAHCKYIRQKADKTWGIAHYTCAPNEAKALERELRMEAMAAGVQRLPLLVEAVIRDGEVVRLRNAQLAQPIGH